MDLEKSLENGQSVLEYALLVSIAIIALIAVNFVARLTDNSVLNKGAFESHFETVAENIAPGTTF